MSYGIWEQHLLKAAAMVWVFFVGFFFFLVSRNNVVIS